MTRGAQLFQAMPGSSAEKAARWGKSIATIDAWSRGLRKPRPLERRKIADAGGPHESAWLEELPLSELNVAPPAVEAATASPAGTRRLADELHTMIQQEIAALRGATEALPGKRAHVLGKLADSAAKLGKLTGHGVLSDAEILSSPVWLEIQEAICVALEPWPDAMLAVASALEGLRAS